MARRRVLWVAVAALGTLSLVALLVPAESGDTYCGTALYDTTRAEPCTGTMTMRLVIGVVALVLGLAFVLVLALGRRVGHSRVRAVSAVVLVGVAVTAALVATNRFLQPTRTEWCGSVVNRHRTYEVAIEKRCDALLAPYRNWGLVATAVSVLSLVVGGVVWRGRHQSVTGADRT